MDEKTLGQRIAAERKKLSLSQEGLGEKVGVSRQAISKWESDAAVPELDNLRTLSRIFGISLDGLLGGDGAPPKQTQPAPARRDWLPVFSLGLSIVLAAVLVSSDLRLRALTAKNDDLENQLHSLKAQMQQLQADWEAQAANTAVYSLPESDLLLSFDLGAEPVFQQGELCQVTLRFAGVAKQWQEGNTGYLTVIREGETVAREKCKDEKGVLTAQITLDVANGYSFWFTQEDWAGVQEQHRLEQPKLERMADSVTISMEVYPQKFTYEEEVLTLKYWGFYLQKPDAFQDQSWTDIQWVLYRDGVEILRQDAFPGEKEDPLRMEYLEARNQLVKLEGVSLPEDRLELFLYARMENGIEGYHGAKTWAVNRHGVLQMQN